MVIEQLYETFPPHFNTLGQYRKSFNHTDPFKNYLRQSEMISTMVEMTIDHSKNKCVDMKKNLEGKDKIPTKLLSLLM